MLAPGGTKEAGVPEDDIPEGKFQLYNGGTNTKPNAPKISRVVRTRTQEELNNRRLTAAEEEQENVDGTEAGGCFNGEATILMADGTYKQARAVKVGDQLKSASGS